VEVKEQDIFTYDDVSAFHWCLDHKVALSFNKNTFQKLAKTETPEFVKISKEPKAYIASDLAKALEEKE
jgi:hypothetical protein